MSIDWDLAPTRAELAREAGQDACAAARSHDIGEDEDGNVGCFRCGDEALDLDEPQDASQPSEDEQQRWAQADLERWR